MREIFSEGELKILEILGNKKMSIMEITEVYYKDDDHAPMVPNNTISNMIRRIVAKTEYNKLPWTLDYSKRSAGGRTVWRAKISRGKV